MSLQVLRALLLGVLVSAAACESPDPPRAPAPDAGQALADAALAAHVKAALLANADLSKLAIDVRTHGGAVHLSGGSRRQLESAALIARSVPGVRSVSFDP